MEALRRLRRNSSDTNVDRRLVTNVLLSFLNTPRADPKRFEMLSLLSSILSWTDPEREKAGLQRAHTLSPSSSFWGRGSSSSASNSPSKAGDLEKSDETEVRFYFLATISVYLPHFVFPMSAVVLSVMGRVPPYRGCRWRNSNSSTATVTIFTQHAHKNQYVPSRHAY